MQSRRYRRPSQPATPGPETLQQLLATVVDLTKLVKSAVDFYLYRIQPDDLQTADVPPPPRKGSRTVKARVPPAVIPPPDAVTLPLCEPTTEASTPKKRLRSAVSSSDSDDDNFALCMDNAEGMDKQYAKMLNIYSKYISPFLQTTSHTYCYPTNVVPAS